MQFDSALISLLNSLKAKNVLHETCRLILCILSPINKVYQLKNVLFWALEDNCDCLQRKNIKNER